MIVKRLLHDF